jgi:hypothetical protein
MMDLLGLEHKRRGRKKGETGNPNGRPRVRHFTEVVRSKTRNGKVLIEMALRIIESAEAKDADKLRAAEFLASYGWGRPVQMMGISSADDVKGLLGLMEKFKKMKAQEKEAGKLDVKEAEYRVVDDSKPEGTGESVSPNP